MLAELLRLVLVVGLVVVVPGVLLVNALFPPRRSELSWLERGYLSVAGGTLLVVLVGVVLGFLPHEAHRRGAFQSLATGVPNVELALLGASALLFAVGLHRGAYPGLARRFPQLAAWVGREERAQS